jgi:hypothetical protein
MLLRINRRRSIPLVVSLSLIFPELLCLIQRAGVYFLTTLAKLIIGTTLGLHTVFVYQPGRSANHDRKEGQLTSLPEKFAACVFCIFHFSLFSTVTLFRPKFCVLSFRLFRADGFYFISFSRV